MKKGKSKQLLTLLIFSMSVINVLMIFTVGSCGVNVENPGNQFNHWVDPQIISVPRGETGTINVFVSDADGDIDLRLIDNTIAPFIRSELQNVTFTPSTINNSTSSILTFDVPPSVAPDTYDMLVKFNGESSELRLIVPELAFSLNDIDSITIKQGETGVVPISISIGGADPIRLVAEGFPAGVDTSFSPNPTTTTQSNLTLAIDASVKPGDYSILVTGYNGNTASTPKGFVLTVAAQFRWVDVTPGSINTLNDLYFIDEMTGVAVGDNGAIFSSSSGGVSGSWVDNSGITSNKLNGVHSDGIAWYAAGNESTILKNSQGTWTLLSSDLNNDLLDVFVVSTNKVFVSGKKGKVYRTDNSGGFWNELEPEPGGSTDFTGIWVTNDSIVTVVNSGIGGKIYRSTDNGVNWNSVHLSAVYNDVKYVTNSLGFAVGQANLIDKTSNGGVTWTNISLNLPSDDFYSVSFFNTEIGYVAGFHQLIWRTGNGGVDWIEENIQPIGSDFLRGVAALNNKNTIAVGSSNGVGIILRRQQ